MKIIVGKNAGFCFGVSRAVNGSIQIAKSGIKTYCLGELVHNSYVISDLKNLGISFIDNLNEVNDFNSQVIIRAHGVPKEIYATAEKLNMKLVDYTCPSVLKIHQIAKDFNEKGYFIFITGKAKHPEVHGIKSYCDYCCVIENPDEIDKALDRFYTSNLDSLLLISQTTFSVEKFNIIREIVEKKAASSKFHLTVKNTICNSTELRQQETAEIAKAVDMMIIIGGKNSSNTKKLYEVALNYCKNSICVESKLELEKLNFGGINTIGIMAGASTPHSLIDEVVVFLKKKS